MFLEELGLHMEPIARAAAYSSHMFRGGSIGQTPQEAVRQLARDSLVVGAAIDQV
jgi:hypothetical protein